MKYIKILKEYWPLFVMIMKYIMGAEHDPELTTGELKHESVKAALKNHIADMSDDQLDNLIAHAVSEMNKEHDKREA